MIGIIDKYGVHGDATLFFVIFKTWFLYQSLCNTVFYNPLSQQSLKGGGGGLNSDWEGKEPCV